jgi:hypothetical protein
VCGEFVVVAVLKFALTHFHYDDDAVCAATIRSAA